MKGRWIAWHTASWLKALNGFGTIQRDILDSEEPDDPDSEAYEEWEEQCELLDEKIEEIEDLIEG